MNTTPPRSEFRIFGICLGMAEQRMRAIAACETITENREIQLLGCDAGFNRNLTIRKGKLE